MENNTFQIQPPVLFKAKQSCLTYWQPHSPVLHKPMTSIHSTTMQHAPVLGDHNCSPSTKTCCTSTTSCSNAKRKCLWITSGCQTTRMQEPTSRRQMSQRRKDEVWWKMDLSDWKWHPAAARYSHKNQASTVSQKSQKLIHQETSLSPNQWNSL